MPLETNNATNQPSRSRAGFSLVEVLLAVSLFALLSVGFVGAYVYGQESAMLSGERARAVLLAEEGIEALRSIRNNDFNNLDPGMYGLDVVNNTWGLIEAPDTQGIYTRHIELVNIGDDRREAAVTVNWQQTPQRDGEITLTTHLTNWQASQSGGGQTDCTGPSAERPPECGDAGGSQGGGGAPPGAGPPGS